MGVKLLSIVIEHIGEVLNSEKNNRIHGNHARVLLHRIVAEVPVSR